MEILEKYQLNIFLIVWIPAILVAIMNLVYYGPSFDKITPLSKEKRNILKIGIAILSLISCISLNIMFPFIEAYLKTVFYYNKAYRWNVQIFLCFFLIIFNLTNLIFIFTFDLKPRHGTRYFIILVSWVILSSFIMLCLITVVSTLSYKQLLSATDNEIFQIIMSNIVGKNNQQATITQQSKRTLSI